MSEDVSCVARLIEYSSTSSRRSSWTCQLEKGHSGPHQSRTGRRRWTGGDDITHVRDHRERPTCPGSGKPGGIIAYGTGECPKCGKQFRTDWEQVDAPVVPEHSVRFSD